VLTSPIPRVARPPADKLHVHFGAGRLGFGLVIPALESSGSPYIVMNRPSAVWAPVVEREKEAQQHVAVKARSLPLPARAVIRSRDLLKYREGASARSPRERVIPDRARDVFGDARERVGDASARRAALERRVGASDRSRARVARKNISKAVEPFFFAD
jgi:hypothetical protein